MRHVGHSSVIQLDSGQLLETRRGSQRDFNIPMPMIWNSIQDWYDQIPYIPVDLVQRPLPPHFNVDLRLMAQWFESSTLLLQQDSHGCWCLVPQDVPTLLVLDGVTGTMIPLFMNIECGLMCANGRQFTEFAQSGLEIQQMWRLEYGIYYRIY